MAFKSSIKQKSFLIIIVSILLTIFLSYSLLIQFYSNSHENHMKTYISSLLAEIEKDYDQIQESIEWTAQNLNLQIHMFKDTEELLASIPSHINENQVLSISDQQQLEMGNVVINKMKATDRALNLLLFIHPIVKNKAIENLLFVHVPFNNMKKEESVFSVLTILLALLAAGVTIIIAKRTFGKSFKQLQDIKLAAIEVSKGNFDAKIWKKSSDEIGEITEAFNMMSTALKDERKRIREYMQDISHEIKTPLTLIKSYNQALMDRMIQDKEDQQKCYRLIDRETNRLQKLFQNFLDFAKLDASTVELEKQPIVFAQSIEDIMTKYKLIFHEKNIKLNMVLDYDVIIQADEERLEQIIQNIVRNAIKYSKDEARIDIVLERKATTCVLAISDNGVGISEEHLSVITNRFVRVNKVRSRKESGTGLGLSIVEKLMALHGGEMTIESQLGVGTTVKLEFPVLQFED
ncbi:MAG: sensor histidine kinase [Bacillus sp. (in: firmicutes)]